MKAFKKLAAWLLGIEGKPRCCFWRRKREARVKPKVGLTPLNSLAEMQWNECLRLQAPWKSAAKRQESRVSSS